MLKHQINYKIKYFNNKLSYTITAGREARARPISIEEKKIDSSIDLTCIFYNWNVRFVFRFTVRRF